MRKLAPLSASVAVLLTMLVTVRPAAAQSGPRFAVGGLVAYAARESEGSLQERLTGVTWGFEGRVMWWRLLVDLRYLEGSLSTDAGDTERDMAEGEAFIGILPLSWVTVKGGAHIRSYFTGDIIERWVFWEVRMRAEVPVFRPTSRSFALYSYLEAWTPLSVDVNVPESVDGGGGLEGGMMFRLAHVPIWAQLAYRIDHVKLGDGTRRETMQQLIFAIGLGR